MKPKVFSHYLSSAFYAALLSVALPLSAEEAKNVEIHLSEIELQEIFNNPTRSYVYVGREISNIADVMEELGKLDDNPASLVHGLAEHIGKGFNIGNYDAVAQALEEAEALLIKHADALGEEKATALTRTLDAIIEQVIEERLNLDAELLTFLKDSVIQEDATKSCCKPKPHCSGLRLLVIKEKLDVLGKAKFRNDVKFKDDVVFEDDVTFEDEVVFEDTVTIEGTLSVADEVVGCDLTVGCNINMNNSTNPAVGNIVKEGVPFMHNFGTDSTFAGLNAGNFTSTGINNTGFGVTTLISNVDGSNNTAVGAFALEFNTTGFNNTAVGSIALQSNTTGFDNTGIGSNALSVNAIGNRNTAVGSSALQLNVGDANVAVGFQSLMNNTTGFFNVAIGTTALLANTIGIHNIAIGSRALEANTTGINNTAVGYLALLNNTIGQSNTSMGVQAINNSVTSNNNTAFGFQALQTSTGGDNTAVGFRALRLSTTGTDNVALGMNAGANLVTGSNNIYIGNAGVAAESATTRIGTNTVQTSCFISGIRGVATGVADAIAVLIDSAGQLGTVSSSAQFKENISDMAERSAAILKLRPVMFTYRSDASAKEQFGLIAEEVAEVLPEIVVNDENGQPFTVQYHVLPVLLVNEIQKLATRVAALERYQDVTRSSE